MNVSFCKERTFPFVVTMGWVSPGPDIPVTRLAPWTAERVNPA